MTAYTEARFNNDEAAREYLERVLWPEGTICPHCGVVGHSIFDQANRRVPVRRTGLPQGLHRHHADSHGALQDRPAQVGAGVRPLYRQQEGLFGPQTASDPWRYLPLRLVHGPPHSRINAPWGPRADGRREADETYFGNYDEERPMPA